MDSEEPRQTSPVFKRPLSPINNTVSSSLRIKRRLSYEKEPLTQTEHHDHIVSTDNECTVETQGETIDNTSDDTGGRGKAEDKSRGFNLKQVNKLMEMNDLYNAQKSKPTESFSFDKSSVITRSNIDREIEYLNDRSGRLSYEYKDLCDRLDRLEEETREIKRNNQKSSIKNKELQNSIIINSRKLENLEVSITKNVMNKEELINFKIKELKQKLKSSLEEIKFNLKEEVNQAKSFNDEESSQKIADLENNRRSLHEAVKELDQEREQKIKQETERIDSQLSATLTEKKEALEHCQDDLHRTESEVADLTGKITAVTSSIGVVNSETEKWNKMITNIQGTSDNFLIRKGELSNRLTVLERKEAKIKATDDEYYDNLKKTNRIYNDTEGKFLKSQNTILALENSIYNLQGKHRVYVNLRSDAYQAEKCTIRTDAGAYTFQKVLVRYNNQQLLNELKFFITTSLESQKNTSILLYGEYTEGLLNDVVMNVYRNMVSKFASATHSCTAVGISTKMVDLFDSMRSIEGLNKSQVMILDDPEVFGKILSTTTSYDGAKLIKIKIENSVKQFEFNIMDLSALPNDQQANGSLITPLAQELLESKTFSLCTLDDSGDSDALLSHLGSF